MKHNASRLKLKVAQGFSLIELLVVLLIIGMGIGMVTMNVGVSGNEHRLQAKQFANLTALVAEEAVLSGVTLGVDLYRDINPESQQGEEVFAYRWLQRTYWIPPEDSEEKARWLWQPVDIPEIVSASQFSPTLRLQLEMEGVERDIDAIVAVEKSPELQKTPLKPDILLWANGEITPFDLKLLAKNDEQLLHTISGDLLGRISLDKTDED
jgi:prepilin-type N-terminal cleavage/methylation domain-containing protein